MEVSLHIVFFFFDNFTVWKKDINRFLEIFRLHILFFCFFLSVFSNSFYMTFRFDLRLLHRRLAHGQNTYEVLRF